MTDYTATAVLPDRHGGDELDNGPALVHAVFEQCARRSPDAVAVVTDGGSLTYAELDRLANRLAHRLAGLGIGPESRVGVCAEPSASLVVAVLGVLKAGAAYVPLDPDYPAERLRYLLDDSSARLVVTQSHLRERLPATDATNTLVLDPPWRGLADAPDATPHVDLTPDGVACVIYTSGSTGSPKGVLVTHAGLTNLASAAAAEFGLRPGDRFLQLASISFSAVLEELFPSLLCGGTVVLAGYRRALPTVPHFLDLLARERVTGFEITTAYWHQLVDELVLTGGRLPACVRFVVMGGDRVRPDAVLAWRTFGIPLIHVYGPTEATATASYFHTAKEAVHDGGLLPIGRAIANTGMHLLDAAMSPVADGEPGEVFVGGRALARGYHGAPARTAERFVPDPVGPPGGRLYRTGDVARRLPDGTVEFLGRVDDQVKIRGFRIEPGEVEVALQRHPDVGDAVVALSADRSDDKHLVAYVTRANGRDPTAADLRAHLGTILPQYMVPAAFVVLREIPKTVHGKVDHAALRAAAAAVPVAADGYVAPRPGTASELAALWSDVLKREPIGATDELFALGGNSLQAARIVAKARRHFGVELLPNDLLREPTVAALADRIDRLRQAGSATDAPADDEREMRRWRDKRQLLERSLAARTDHPRVSLISPSQRNLWLLSKVLPTIPLYNEAWQCRLVGPLDVDALRWAVGEIVKRHETLRTRFDMVDGEPVQLVDEPGEVPFVYCDLSTVDPADRRRAAEDARDKLIRVPLDPKRQHLMRVLVFAIGPDEHLFVGHVHHLVFDGISKEVFLDELAAFYRAYRSGEPASVPALDMQYGEFALWQREYLTGPAQDALLDYWRAQLDGAPPLLELPSDRPAPPVQDYAGGKVVLILPGRLRERVHAVARREHATPFMVLFTALCSQLHRRTGQTDLCVGTPVANRTRPGIDGLIGCFINSLALRVRLDAARTYRQALARVRTASLSAIEHQALPLERLIEALRPERRPGRNPLFQVWFAMEDETPLPRDVDGVTFDDFQAMSTGLSVGVAKLDLTWIVVDQGDRMVLSLTYCRSMFDDGTVRAMADEYRNLLEELVDDPGANFAASTPSAGGASSVEDQILVMWREAFENGDIGAHDDFFELGGYSMLAVQLVTGVYERFGVEVSFADFFESPTVAGLAGLVAAAGERAGGGAVVPAAAPAGNRSLEDILAELDHAG